MIEYTPKTKKRFEVDVKKLKASDPKLNQINYHSDGHMEMTNKFIAMRLKNINHDQQPIEDYPEMNHIFDRENLVYSITLKTKDIENIVESFKRLKPYKIKIFNGNGQLTITPLFEHQNSQDGAFSLYTTGMFQQFTYLFDYKLLLLALKFMRMLGADTISIYEPDNKRDPISFIYKNVEVVLVRQRSE